VVNLVNLPLGVGIIKFFHLVLFAFQFDVVSGICGKQRATAIFPSPKCPNPLLSSSFSFYSLFTGLS